LRRFAAQAKGVAVASESSAAVSGKTVHYGDKPLPVLKYDAVDEAREMAIRQAQAERREAFLRGPQEAGNSWDAAMAAPDVAFASIASPEPTHLPLRVPQPATEVTTLGNGMRVATETNGVWPVATVGVWIDAGSRFETEASNGTAHFLEHMAFKGTQKRTLRQLEEGLENMGAHLNAYTSREQTVYYAKCMAKDVPECVDVLGDILQNSVFRPADVERERGVILREMEEVEGMPEEVLFDHLHSTAFQGTPLGRTILGPPENVRAITKEQIEEYIATHYTAPRMVFSAAGAVDHSQMCKLVDKAFGGLPSEGLSTADLVEQHPAHFTGSSVIARDDNAEKGHVAVAWKGCDWKDEDAIPLMLCQTMLGAWDAQGKVDGVHMGSKMCQLVAGNKLAQSVMAFNTNYTDTGLFGVYTVLKDTDKMVDLMGGIMESVQQLSMRPDERDLQRAKNILKGNMCLAMEGSSAVAEDIGRQLLVYGRRVTLSEMFARIDGITTADIKNAGMRFLWDKDIAIAATGDVSATAITDYNWVRRRTYSLLS